MLTSLVDMDHETKIVTVGTHEFWFVPPNQVRFYLRGTVDGPEVEAQIQFAHEYANLCGGLLDCVIDLTKFERATESARQFYARSDRPFPYRGSAIVGASRTTRTITNMVMSAARLLAPKPHRFPIQFVDTWDEAEAWFAELRGQG